MIDRAQLTRQLLGRALRRLRASRSQREIAERMTTLDREINPGVDREKAASQISDWEHGKAFPELANLLTLLAACTDTGRSVDLCRLQKELELLLAAEGRSFDEPLDEFLVPGSEPEHLRAGVEEYSRRTRLQELSEQLEEMRQEIERLKDSG